MYVWSKRAFGSFAGFITGWTYWASNLPYFPALLYFAAGNALFVGGTNGGALAASPAYFIAFAIAGLALATIVNVYGLAVGKWLNNAGAVSRWIVTLLLVALGGLAWWKFGSATPINAATMRPGFQIKDIIFWSVIAFAWTGPESMPFMGGEIKRPRRTIPLGLAIAAPAIAIIYIGGTVSVLAALVPHDVNPSSGVMQGIQHVASRLRWNALTPIAAVLVALSCVGSAGAWLGAVARIPFVAGIDHYLPPRFRPNAPALGFPGRRAGHASRHRRDLHLSRTRRHDRPRRLQRAGQFDRRHHDGPFPLLVRFGAEIPRRAADAGNDPDTRRNVDRLDRGGDRSGHDDLAIVFAGFPADDDPNKVLAVVKVSASRR